MQSTLAEGLATVDGWFQRAWRSQSNKTWLALGPLLRTTGSVRSERRCLSSWRNKLKCTLQNCPAELGRGIWDSTRPPSPLSPGSKLPAETTAKEEGNGEVFITRVIVDAKSRDLEATTADLLAFRYPSPRRATFVPAKPLVGGRCRHPNCLCSSRCDPAYWWLTGTCTAHPISFKAPSLALASNCHPAFPSLPSVLFTQPNDLHLHNLGFFGIGKF